MATTRETSEALKEAVEELDAAREAARLKLHLLSLDAKKAWTDVEARFRETQKALGGQGEHAAEVSAKAVRDLARSIRKFLEEHV